MTNSFFEPGSADFAGLKQEMRQKLKICYYSAFPGRGVRGCGFWRRSRQKPHPQYLQAEQLQKYYSMVAFVLVSLSYWGVQINCGIKIRPGLAWVVFQACAHIHSIDPLLGG